MKDYSIHVGENMISDETCVFLILHTALEIISYICIQNLQFLFIKKFVYTIFLQSSTWYEIIHESQYTDQ